MRSRSSHRSPLLVAALLALTTSFANAAEVFTITASFTDDDFALAEFAARLETCVNDFGLLANDLKADCISRLVSSSATCSTTTAGAFVCVVDGVTIDTADIIFECDQSTGCPSANADVKALMDTATSCPDAAEEVAGFVGSCYPSAYCLVNSGDAVTSFGDFCPSLTGEYCCGAGITRNNEAFPTATTQTNGIDESDFYRKVDHMVNMDFKLFYDVAAPAQLQLKVEVPYVEEESNLTYTENGNEVVRQMCPTAYLIDFEPPVETYPQDSESPVRIAENWLPLSHFPHQDLLGRPRSTCGNYDMSYDNENAFASGFSFPGNVGSLTYGNVPAVAQGVWDTSQGTTGIPHDAVTFWNKGTAIGTEGKKRLNYTIGEGEQGHFDLVKAWTKCKNFGDDAQLVRKQPNPEDSFINGVAYPVETYEWTLSVCAVGYFGPNCRTRTDPQMYAKTCQQVPASFSITPQQIAHVTVAPVTDKLVSKTFLQKVDAFVGSCPDLYERIAVTLNLVIFGTNYEIVTSDVHDLLSPANVFENEEDTKNFNVTEGIENTFVEYLANQGESSVGEGVYVLGKKDVGSGTVSVYYRKIVVVSKCYKTEWNGEEATRANPAIFSDAIAGAAENVLFDVEIIVEKSVVDIKDGASDQQLPGDSKIRNTLNLRVLATKETFVLPTENKLKQKDVTAYQKLYGSYEIAKLDTAAGLPNALPESAILSGGDQVCSKHQLIEYDAQAANLLPNAVGSCMLKNNLGGQWDTLKGSTIKYKTTGMVEPADYTYGCFPDWIDTTGVTPTADGVYVFSGAIPRVTDVHDSIFWFVQKQQLEQTQMLAGELMTDRFGTALFWYDTNVSDARYVVTKSPQFQHNTNTVFTTNPAGCVVKDGAMKSSCNLVCFDLVDGLLTDPLGQQEREVLVHHVSVATVANEEDSVAGNKLTARRHRRTLLESVASTARQSESLPTATAAISVMPGPEVRRQVNIGKPDQDRPNVAGPKGFQTWFYPVFFCFIFASVATIAGCAHKTFKGQERPWKQMRQRMENQQASKSNQWS